VSRHVHKTDPNVAQIEFREAQINCDSTPLFFRQTNRDNARQRAHKRRFAMIYVSGCADNNRAH
jgi:hypothetical protein